MRSASVYVLLAIGNVAVASHVGNTGDKGSLKQLSDSAARSSKLMCPSLKFMFPPELNDEYSSCFTEGKGKAGASETLKRRQSHARRIQFKYEIFFAERSDTCVVGDDERDFRGVVSSIAYRQHIHRKAEQNTELACGA